MNKFITSAVLLSNMINGMAQSNNPAPYCASVFDNNYNMINNISIDGTSLSFGAMGTWGTFNTYLYYDATAFSPVEIGSDMSIQLNVYSPNDMEPMYFAMWIDYNQNDVFENTELVLQNSNTINDALPTFGAAVSPINKTITIPGTTLPGTTRVRLMRGSNPANPYVYSNAFSLSPCPSAGANTYGCTYDFDITFEEPVNTSGLETNSDATSGVTIYPNPACDAIWLQGIDDMSSGMVKIYDQLGQLVLEQSFTTFDPINVSELPKGVYSVLVSIDSYRQYSTRFVK